MREGRVGRSLFFCVGRVGPQQGVRDGGSCEVGVGEGAGVGVRKTVGLGGACKAPYSRARRCTGLRIRRRIKRHAKKNLRRIFPCPALHCPVLLPCQT